MTLASPELDSGAPAEPRLEDASHLVPAEVPAQRVQDLVAAAIKNVTSSCSPKRPPEPMTASSPEAQPISSAVPPPSARVGARCVLKPVNTTCEEKQAFVWGVTGEELAVLYDDAFMPWQAISLVDFGEIA
eukprot:3705919-Pleurochrysis_carterae.AAC.2